MQFLEEDPEFKAAILAAERAEDDRRNYSLLGIPLNLCGVIVRPFTLRHSMELMAIRSPFIVGGNVSKEDIVKFLWVVSGRKGSNAKKQAFSRKHGKFDAIESAASIRKYIDDAFSDAKMGSENESPSVSFSAYVIDALAVEYGWNRDEIKNLAFVEIFQYLRLIHSRRMGAAGKLALFVNAASHRARRQFAQREIARRKAEKEAKRG